MTDGFAPLKCAQGIGTRWWTTGDAASGMLMMITCHLFFFLVWWFYRIAGNGWDRGQEAEQARQLRRLSLSVVRRQQRSAVTPVFVVLATLLTSPGDQKTGLDLDRLVQRFNSLNRLVAGYAKPCQLNGKGALSSKLVASQPWRIAINERIYSAHPLLNLFRNGPNRNKAS